MSDTARTAQELAPLAHRGLRPAQELAEHRPHGNRLRYMAGCRCDECRGANTAYEKERAAARKAGDWNGLVSAEAARKHMAALSAQGIGRRTVGDVAGVADSVLTAIIAGTKQRIRARTEKAVLAVTKLAAADRAYIDAAPTWRLLEELIADGYSKTRLARELGYSTHALQLKRTRVTARNAYEVERLYARLRCCNSSPTRELLAELSDEGFHHARVQRELTALAEARGLKGVDFTERKGRVQVAAAELVAELHARLTA